MSDKEDITFSVSVHLVEKLGRFRRPDLAASMWLALEEYSLVVALFNIGGKVTTHDENNVLDPFIKIDGPLVSGPQIQCEGDEVFAFKPAGMEMIDKFLHPKKIPTREHFIHMAIEYIDTLVTAIERDSVEIYMHAPSGKKRPYHPLLAVGDKLRVLGQAEVARRLGISPVKKGPTEEPSP